MLRSGLTLITAGSVALLAACSSSGSGASTNTARSSPAAITTSPPAAAPASTSTQSGVATSLDPCQLVTSSEASSLAGTTFAAGKEEKTSGGGKICVYGYQTLNVFTVEVGQGHSNAAARAQWSQQESKVKAALNGKLPAGVGIRYHVAEVPGLGDRAATIVASASIAGHTFGISGIYVLKGATFFAFQDLLLGHKPPTASAMQTEAQTVLGRI